jgi:membrane-bound metal-dependent hydrolase YbcI (DUF457 family)
MQGPSHLLVSWFYADASGIDSPRERRIVAWAGLAPDIDVLAYIAALAYYRLDQDAAFENVWRVVHHRYTHGLAFVLLIGVVAWALASDSARRWRVVAFAMLAGALHNFFDIVAGGPTWPVYPLWPLSDAPWSASWSWAIGEWPNLVILAVCFAGTFAYARFAGRSPLECFGDRADAWFVGVVRQGSSVESERRSGATRWIIWAAVALIVVAVLAPLGFRP